LLALVHEQSGDPKSDKNNQSTSTSDTSDQTPHQATHVHMLEAQHA